MSVSQTRSATCSTSDVKFRIATRGSALATWQAEHVAALLHAHPALAGAEGPAVTVSDTTALAEAPDGSVTVTRNASSPEKPGFGRYR